MTEEMGAFEKDTLYRSLLESARCWVIEHHMRAGGLPKRKAFYFYADGEPSFNWGNPPGVDAKIAVMRKKRVKITLSVEDY